MNRLRRPVIMAVSDRRRVAPEARTLAARLIALERWIEELVEGGVDILQIREADLPTAILAGLVGRAAASAHGSASHIVVNDRADVAQTAGAAGVHVPSTGLPLAPLRAWQPDWLIGRSVHPGDPLQEPDADYLLFGTVFSSRSKPDQAPAGIDALAAAASRARQPVLAIGGVTLENAERCMAAGAAGVAAIGIFLPDGCEPGAIGPRAGVVELRARLENVPRPGPGSASTLLE